MGGLAAAPAPSGAGAGDGLTPKHFLDGTHRICSPEATWRAIQPALASAAITRVADVTALDGLGVPVYQAVRPASRNLSVSQGKGLSAAAARVSAAMEALELWHAEDLGELPRLTMSPREMRRSAAIPLTALRWSADSRAWSDQLAAAPLEWLTARSLLGERDGFLPRAMLELDFTPAEPLRPRPFDLTSNGLASGNCREEAELHALCELIERHALALAERDPTRKVPLAPAIAPPEWCRDLYARVRAGAGSIALWDLTWAARVPVVLAELALPDLPHVWRGSGCHPSPEVALSRALTEAAQSRLTYIAGARDDLVLLAGAPAGRDATRGFAVPPPRRALEDLPDLATASLGGDIAAVLERLAGLGCQPFAVDLSRPRVGVPVVFAFIPGLLEARH